MKTIIISVDFSDTAYNAAVYAIQLAKQVQATQVILYHAFALPTIADGGLAIPIITNVDDVKLASTNALEDMRNKLNDYFVYLPFEIKIQNSYNTVISGVIEAAAENDAKLIVMGITGGSAIEEVLIGSNTIDVAKHTKIPVLIVPPKALFKPIRNAVFVSSLLEIAEITPIETISSFLEATKTHLKILHVEADETTANYSGTEFESVEMNTLFADYKPQYCFVQNANFINGVNDFVDANETDILIIIPKKHGLFESLFSKSHTKMLAFHSHVPLLVVHD